MKRPENDEYEAPMTPRERARAAADSVKRQQEKEKRRKKKRRKQLMAVYLIAFFMIAIVSVAGAIVIKLYMPKDTGGEQIYAGTERDLTENKDLKKTEAVKETTTEKQGLDFTSDDYNGIKDLNSDFWYNGGVYEDDEEKTDDYFANVCFIGDSRTKGMLEFSNLPKYHGFYEIGFTAKRACQEHAFTVKGKDGTYNVLKAISMCKDEIYYIGFGVNDMAGDLDSFLEYYKKIVDKIYECHPNAIVYVENILPVSQKYESKNPAFSNQKAIKFNQALNSYCKEDGRLIYLDVASVCYDEEGAANTSMVADGLHYNREGYAIIREYIKTHVVKKIE